MAFKCYSVCTLPFQDKSLWTKFNAPLFAEIRFNPVVSFCAISLIWAFVIICAVHGKEVPFKEWRGWVVDTFTWMYIGAENVFFLFAIILFFRGRIHRPF